MSNKMLRQKRRKNIRLYPFYASIGLDYMFYYGIKVLFLSQVKHISYADIVFATSIYALFATFLPIPISILIDKLGQRKTLVIGNALNTLSMILIIICPSFLFYIFEEFICAIAFTIKGITESSILESSIPKFRKKGEMFSKVRRNGYSRYCYMYALSTLIAGFLYNFNPYIPLTLCTAFCFLATIVSYYFSEIEVDKNQKEELSAYRQELKYSFKFIFQSGRLRALLIILGLIWGLIGLFDTYQIVILEELNISASYIGVILAIFQIAKGKMSKFANKMNRKTKNKTLTIISLSMSLSFLICGLVAITNINRLLQVFTIVIAGSVIASGEGIYQIVKNRYLNSFTTSKILPKIYSANSMINYLIRMIVGLVGTLVLSYFNIKYTMILIGMWFTAFVWLLFYYAKPRLGLKPENYKPEDIKFKV